MSLTKEAQHEEQEGIPMRSKKPAIFAIWLGLALAVLVPANQSRSDGAEVALHAAIKTETVDGDLKGAIAQYLKLANGGHRGVAAKALVRLGQCYEKRGDAQAREAYDRVVRDFADQKETAAAAKARLAALNRKVSGPALVTRRVWSGPEVNTEGAPSWDGRYLSFTDRASSNIALRDLATGETRLLTKNSDIRQYPSGRSLISPDGKFAAFAWINGTLSCELRLIGTDGFGQRVLHSDKSWSGLELGAWSPDGARIAAAITSKTETNGIEINQIALISARDGSVRILKGLGSRRPHPRGFSPDGRFIVCDYSPREDAENRDIFLLAADGSLEVPLVQHPADDRLLGWAPDGSGILFASNRSGSWGAWFIPVENGKPKGLPELVKSDAGEVEPLGFTRSGSFYFGIESGGMDAYVASLDPTSSRLAAAPVRITSRLIGQNQHPLFSPDGKSLAYFSNRTADQWVLCLRSLETGDDREFSVPPDLQRLRNPRWAASGEAILVSGVDKQLLHLGFYRIDPRTGETAGILSSNPEVETWRGHWTPDRKSMFLARAGDVAADKNSIVVVREMATGREREIYRPPSGADITNLALSPDGQELALTIRSWNGNGFSDKLAVMPAQGEGAHELLSLNGHESVRRDGLVWTPDGRYLLFAKAIETSPHAFRLELWRVSPRDQESSKVGVLGADLAFGDGSSGLCIHPDGKTIAFHAGQRKPEVWLIENFQPAPKAAEDSQILNELTVEAWINASSLSPDQQTILVKGDHNYDGAAYGLSLTAQGKILWGVRHYHLFYGDGGDWSIDAIVTDTSLNTNTWYQVVGTIYSSRSASIYVNGALSKAGVITQSIPSRPAEPLRIGSSLYFGTPKFFFKGMIDEVAVFERVLSADEILQHYQAGLKRKRGVALSFGHDWP